MIDTHCHIDDPQYLEELDAVIARQQEEGVEAILVPGVNEASLTTVPEVCRRYPDYLYPALGLHPEDVRADYRDVLTRIYNKVQEVPVVAIGEIGLDYHFSTEFKAEQQDALRIQLGWAVEKNLPVMIHCRDAMEDTLHILQEFPTLRGVFHCYSGSYETAQQLVNRGWYLGIGGVLTFKNCKLAEHLVPTDGRPPIPLERLMLETDAPYMAPVPYRGKPNESRYMKYVVEKLAIIYQTDTKTVISATNTAAKSLFLL